MHRCNGWLLAAVVVAVALVACGPAGGIEGSDLGSTQQATYMGNLGSALGSPVATGTTAGRTNDFKPSCVSSSNAPDVSYSWTAPATDSYKFTTFGSSFDTVLEVRPYNNTSQSLGCNDDSGGLQSSLTLGMTQGQQVLIIIDGYGSGAGNYKLNIAANCGDGVCTGGETCSSCATDCGICQNCSPSCAGKPDGTACGTACGGFCDWGTCWQ